MKIIKKHVLFELTNTQLTDFLYWISDDKVYGILPGTPQKNQVNLSSFTILEDYFYEKEEYT